jgi:sugar phosphate isomerase/epimerase
MVTASELLAPYASVVQLKDCPAGDPTVAGGPPSVALGEGVAPLDRVVTALSAAGYAGPVCVEIASLAPGSADELDLVSRSIDWLKGHLVRP